MSKLYTVTEAAEILGVSTNTIWRWIREGKLEFCKLGSGLTRISEEQLQRFITEESHNGKH